jgi:hypothetical protein
MKASCTWKTVTVWFFIVYSNSQAIDIVQFFLLMWVSQRSVKLFLGYLFQKYTLSSDLNDIVYPLLQTGPSIHLFKLVQGNEASVENIDYDLAGQIRILSIR